MMLTFEEAKKVGIRACVDKLGYDFVRKYEDNTCTAYGNEEDHAFCFVGLSTEPRKPWNGGSIILDDSPEKKFPFSASCNVSYTDGKVTYLECLVPEMT
ncbi:MAG: hypothetical protein IJ242_11650 [Clostridia bacterium]|nr:hypothetical protein [Clostridia bacterium]